MYNQRINYVIVGLFVIAMLVAGAVSLALLTGRTGTVERYQIVLDNVADVKFGTQVRYEGYPIGQVERILPTAETGAMRFRLDLSVRQGWLIPADSVARIGSSTFLSAKTIDITGGVGTALLQPGATIPSGPPADMFATMATAAERVSALSDDKIQPLLDTLASLAQTVEGATPLIADQLVAFTQRLNDVLEPLQEILAEENVQSVRRTLGKVEETAVNLANVSGDLRGTLAALDALTGHIDRLVVTNGARVDQSLKDVQYTLRTISRSVGSVVHNLDGSARNMNEFSRLIRQNPGLLLNGQPREAVSPATLPGRDHAQR